MKHTTLRPLFSLLFLLIFLLPTSVKAASTGHSAPRKVALPQLCPLFLNNILTASDNQILTGLLVYHKDIRNWFELKLDRPQCGKASIQVTAFDGDWISLQMLRGCHVASQGIVEFSSTGYFSRTLYQNTEYIKPVGHCVRKPPFPAKPRVNPDPSVHHYSVHMHVNYKPGDHPVIFHIFARGKELHPWQAYADYWLTGDYVLYGDCHKGYFVDKVFGTREANPSHFDEVGADYDEAMFDPESAADSGKTDLDLGYSCTQRKK